MVELVCTRAARIEVTKEMRNNKVSFEFGRDLESVICDETNPKVKMSIKMTVERLGQRCMVIKHI
jgi:hypothetical protein